MPTEFIPAVIPHTMDLSLDFLKKTIIKKPNNLVITMFPNIQYLPLTTSNDFLKKKIWWNLLN